MAKRKEADYDWASRIKSTKDKADDYMSAILWGGFGSGKTLFGGSCPAPIFIAVEDGTLSLSKSDIPYIPIVQDPEISVYGTMLDIFAHADQKLGVFEDKDTIVLDSMSKLGNMIKNELLLSAGREKAEFDEWDMLKTRMNRLNNLFIRLPYNRIVILSEAYKEDKYEKELVPMFNLEGSFRSDVSGEYDNVFWFEKKPVGKNTKYLMHTVDCRGRAAKARLNLPAEIENPTYDKVITLSKEN